MGLKQAIVAAFLLGAFATIVYGQVALPNGHYPIMVPASPVPTCESTVVSSGGAGSFTDACVTTASRCSAQDITDPHVIPYLSAPGSGSIAYSSVGATDSVIVGCD